jgi:hypothetical protein
MFLQGRGELELGSIPIARSGTVAYERFKRYARQCGKVRKRPGCLHTVKLQGVPTVRIQSMPATGDQQLIDWFSFREWTELSCCRHLWRARQAFMLATAKTVSEMLPLATWANPQT